MIVITTPTGLIGRQVLDIVVRGEEPVRVIVRDPNGLTAEVRDRVEIVQGSHGDHQVVERAFDGAHSVFWLVPPDPHSDSVMAAYVDFSRPASDALRTHAVERVVTVSALGREWPRNSGYVAASLAMDDLIAGTGVSLRAMTMPSFMDNIIRQVNAIRTQGMFFSPISPDRKFPMCATRDIAAVAASLLLDRSWSGQDSVAVLGPEDLSPNEMATIMSGVLATPIRFQQISGDVFAAQLTGSGMSSAMAQGMVDMMAAKNDGLDNAVERTPQSTTPTTFRQWCEEVLKPAVAA